MESMNKIISEYINDTDIIKLSKNSIIQFIKNEVK